MLRVRGLTKTIGATSVLQGVELEVARGESVGVAGADGSGLSTLLQILGTLLPPSAGTIEVDGVDAVVHLHGARRQLTYCGETPLLGHGLSVGEYLRFRLTARRGNADSRYTTEEALARTGFAKNAAVDLLSPGMRHGLSLAGALAGQPGLLLLDLPLQAIDAGSRAGLLTWLSEARRNGMALVAAINTDQGAAGIHAHCERVLELRAGRLTSRDRADLLPGQTTPPAEAN